MRFENLRNELKNYYWNGSLERSKTFAEKCFGILDRSVTDNMSAMEQKLLQYKVIVDEFEPKLFLNSPFYYETAVLSALSDGAFQAKENGNIIQANGWVYARNKHLFIDQDPDLWEKRCNQATELLYLICGPYNDVQQHFNFNNRPILQKGLKGVYEDAEKALETAETDSQKEFLQGVMQGMLEIKRMAEKFAQKAEELLISNPDNENLKLIVKTAKRVPWQAPQTFYEALNTLAFMRKVIGSLEGAGPNTFGRIDMDLYPFYESDIKAGVSKEEIYELITKFLITWDCHYDHDMKMVGYADHELENTYVLGGCDKEGRPVYNDLTKMFLTANREEKIIFPKIKCRFSDNSPKEYFDEMNKDLIKGTSTLLYANDNAIINGFINKGSSLEDARDYLITGCWGVELQKTKYDHGNYINFLKPFEYALHKLYDKMEKVQLKFEIFDDCESFDELYNKILKNCEILLKERVNIGKKGGQIFKQVNPLPIFSSGFSDCLEKKADYRNIDGRCDVLAAFGFTDILDSMLAIKTLVFDTKKYTLQEYLTAVRQNWEGFEDMRIEATKCPGWGDGSKEACSMAVKFQNDLGAIADKTEGIFGGKICLEYCNYTEIRFWGERTLATPNGRKNGEYFAQGLTPSRLKKIPYVNDVVNSFACLNSSEMVNNVSNFIFPVGKTTLDYCESFLRVASKTALQSIQLNCTSKEQLLDAQKHPENYQDLIVRVTGFSAKFTSLSPEWQQEVITRNFYE